MSDWARLAHILRAASEREETLTLATVVATEGSAYRRPGAWMVVSAGGEREGLLSGGCLEADVAERAAAIRIRGASELVTYATGDAEDLVWGLRMGCPGALRVLIEPLEGTSLESAASFFERAGEASEDGVMATALPPGRGRLLVTSAGTVASDGGTLPASVAGIARRRLSGPATLPAVETIGAMEVALAAVSPRIRLVICGAGDDAAPLAQFAADLGWDVLVADHRSAAAAPERFLRVRTVAVSRADELLPQFPRENARTAAVIMTHNVDRDVEWAATLLSVDLGYLGFLGPKRRGDQILATAQPLAAGGVRARRIASPAGLDIGSETPREIALSIVAEIAATLSGRNGGRLADREAPIHAPAPGIARPDPVRSG
ncbi:MAG: XdhC family protein [Acidobacteriota bacterium]